MPTQDNNELPHVFDADGARRIVDVVRRVENMPRNLRRDVPNPIPPAPRAFWFAQNSAFQLPNTSATTWAIFSGTFGSEATTSITSFAKGVYVRHGACYANTTYILIEINGGFEVLNPTKVLLAKSTATINAKSSDSSGCAVYHGAPASEVSDSTTITGAYNYSNCAINSGKFVFLTWGDWYDTGNLSWFVTLADTS